MRKFFTVLFASVTLLTLLAAVGLGILLAKFDPNKYRSQFQAALEEATGWKITLHDPLSISFLPDISLSTGRASVEIPGNRNGQAIECAAVTLILSGEHLHQGFLDVQEVIVHEMTLNQDCLPASLFPDDGSNPTINEALLSIAREEGLPTDSLSAANSGTNASPKAKQQAQSGGIRLKARFPGRTLVLVDSALTGKDEKGDLAWTLFLSRADFHNVGLNADVSLTAKGEFADRLNLKKASFSVEAVTRLSEQGMLHGRIAKLQTRMEGFGDLPLVAEASLIADYGLHSGELSFKDVSGTLRLADGLGVPSGLASKTSSYTGSLSLRFPKEGLAGAVSGTVHASRLDTDLLLHGLDPSVRFVQATEESIKGAPNFTRPKVTRVLTSTTGTQLKSMAGKNEYPSYDAGGKAPLEPHWISALAAGYHVSLDFAADELITHGLPLESLILQIRSSGGKATLPFSFHFFRAQINGNASVDIAGKIPAAALACKFKGLHMGKLSSVWGSNYFIGGVAGGSFEIRGRGDDLTAFINNLSGKAAFEVINGEVRGFNLIPPDLPHFENLPESFLFRKLSASAVVEGGKATTQDILLESNVLSAKGSGVVHLSFGQIDIGMNFTQEGRAATVPVFISGPYASLSSTVDMAAYNQSLDRLGLGQYYDGYQSPYHDGGRSGYDGYGRPEASGRQGGYYSAPPADPYRRYLNNTPLSGVQWQGQGQNRPAPAPPQSRMQQPQQYPQPPLEQQDRGRIAPMRNPAEIIYGR